MRILIAAAAACLLVPASAFACACCADPGYWSSAVTRLRANELEQLDRIRFSRSATTYVGAGGLDGVLGITSPSTAYGLKQARSGRRWTFRLTSPGERTRGTLSFVLPASALVFATDLRNGRTSMGGGPLLYKEWRLAGTVSGTGDFLPRTTATYRLILHGRGNVCLDARDFTRWTLQVRGAGARFTLFGSLRR